MVPASLRQWDCPGLGRRQTSLMRLYSQAPQILPNSVVNPTPLNARAGGVEPLAWGGRVYEVPGEYLGCLGINVRY